MQYPHLRRLDLTPDNYGLGFVAPHALLAGPSIFSQSAIDRSIDRALADVPDGKNALVAHLDENKQVTAVIVQRFGDHVIFKAGATLDASQGLKLDREHLAWKASIQATW